MKKTIFSIVCLCLFSLFSAQAQTISRGQKFWDGHTLYTVSQITPDGTVIFAGATYDPQRGIADGVDMLRLKKTAQPGKYKLVASESRPCPFRCKWGAEVQYIRQSGMNFLAVKNSKGQTVEVLTLTPDNVKNCHAQQRQMEQDATDDLNMAAGGLLMNTHTMMPLEMKAIQAEAKRLSSLARPDIIEKTNAQMLKSEIAFRNGEAEGGYDNPDGLGGDGRGTEEDETEGVTVNYQGDEYIRVATAQQFIGALGTGRNILVAKDTEINLTPFLNMQDEFSYKDRQWCEEGRIYNEGLKEPFVVSEGVFDGRQLTLVNFKQMAIVGEGNSRIVVEPRYAFCLRFVNCQQVEIRNLTIGHTTGGYCQGGVIGVTGGWRISVQDCNLYGCGTYGFELEGTRDFSCYRSVIHDCTYGIMLVHDTEFAKFETCDFLHNREFSLIESRNSDLTFYECRFYANHGDAPLFDIDREFYLAGCEIYHPTENLGTIDKADQSGPKNWFDENPLNPNIMKRKIGPDAE